MKVDGLAPIGGIWGVRCECVPIVDARHFENVDGYILDHQHQGAEIWPMDVDVIVAKNDMDRFDPDSLFLH